MKPSKKITKKSLQALDDIPFGDGTRLTEKDKKEISEFLQKRRRERKNKSA